MRVLLALSLLAPAPAADWRPSLRLDHGRFVLRELEATGPKDAWAFGTTPQGIPAARRWNGRTWKKAVLPGAVFGSITSVDSSSPRNVWAFGGDAMRFDGHRWKIVKRFGKATGMSSRVFGPKNVWVVLAGDRGRDRLAHYDGRRWKTVRTGLDGVRIGGTSSTDLWAIGDAGAKPVLRHRTSKGWSTVRPGAMPRQIPRKEVAGSVSQDVRLTGLTVVSRKNVWVTGEIWRDVVSGDPVSDPTDEILPFALHWNGRRWSRVTLPETRNGEAGPLAPDGRGGYWWSSSDDAYDVYGPGRARLFHWTGKDGWRERPAPGGQMILAFERIPGTRGLWAQGLSYVTAAQTIFRSGAQ
ncbi:hypothetical protein [Actinocorallia longicatena]|uniref:Uncharacterized protein n=1 Tax=Actinocorallia longicatena TaxID=111803 RepID=A0ABP6QBN0_9ACTN